MSQKQLIFFGPNHSNKTAPTHEEKLWAINRSNPKAPFSKFIGNDKAFSKIQTAAYTALGRHNHLMRELSFGLYGPASAGKTTLARLYADTVGLPFVELSPKAFKTIEGMFQIIKQTLESFVVKKENANLHLVEIKPKHYKLPPCVLLIDEVHALSNTIVQGLLKATEYDDSTLATETGRVVNTECVTWMIATTDEGSLFDAFRTRFSPVVLKPLNKAEISKCVKIAHPDFEDAICDLVAHYNSRIPRKALEFARLMKMTHEMTRESWDVIAQNVAYNEGIDEFGMPELHLQILRHLKSGPIARNRISILVGRRDEEIQNYVMPLLLTETDDQPALVKVTQKGYALLEAGMRELLKREIILDEDVA